MILSEDAICSLIGIAIKDFCFEKLHNIYSEIPHTRCKCCGKCCKNAPRVYLIEYLQIFRGIKESFPDRFYHVIRRILEFGFLSLVNTFLSCPFLEEGKCIIYDYRSFNCRVWGHAKQEEYYSTIDLARRELEQRKKLWNENFSIRIPDVIVYGHKPFCEDVKPLRGSMLETDKRESLEMKLESLNNQFVKVALGTYEQGLLELPLFVCLSFIGPIRFYNSRPYIMEEYQNNKKTDFMDRLIYDSLPTH
ncbi:MAG: YkgJ family cysteine cluster protein [Thermodesulfobacteriota bacterium]|nr:YkgJ family cysteine cluster protein [Thermodesulfobacteriota bacterium]